MNIIKCPCPLLMQDWQGMQKGKLNKVILLKSATPMKLNKEQMLESK